MLKPAQLVDALIEAAAQKAEGSFLKIFTLAILAGAFIAFGGEASNMAAFNLLAMPETYGLGRLVAGMVFPVGLMLIIIGGGELFTGNTLMFAAVADKRIKLSGLLRNWVIVYIGNFIGAVLVAAMIYYSGLLSSGGYMLGAVTVKIAAVKTSLYFGPAFVMGIMCNWLVSLAVWVAYASERIVGKIFAIFFPICLFVTSGFEHCIANMYYIPVGIFAKANDKFAELSGCSTELLDNLTWSNFFVDNLIPVTLGNIVGGSIFVAMAYFVAHKKA